MFQATVLCSSLNPHALPHDPNLLHRLTTMELEYPRCIHSEFLTHRMFSRNSASSRAIPIDKMIKRVVDDPFIPIVWGKNQSGMQAHEEFTLTNEIAQCREAWTDALDSALVAANDLKELGLHKQIVNRILEPFQWITVIATGNAIAWENFFHLRCSNMAEPHIREVAYMAREAYDAFEPTTLTGELEHLPLVNRINTVTVGQLGEFIYPTPEEARAISTGRCARISYLTHHGIHDWSEDIRLHNKLRDDGHWSPFEHPARPNIVTDPNSGGNFGPWWAQYRKHFQGECCSRADRSPKP